MTDLDERQLALKDRFVEIHGVWRDGWGMLLRRSPEYFEAYCELSSVPVYGGALEPKVKELLQVAVNSAATHLFVPGLAVHVEKALRLGASAEEIMEVFQLTSVLGIHTLTVGVPILLEVADEVGIPTGLAPLSPDKEKLKATFVATRGYWTDLWETVLKLSPEYFEAYSHLSSVPWTEGALEPKAKELVYVAITASTTHLFEPGIRVHIRNAFDHGATMAEILEVFEIVSLLGIHTLTVGLPILEDALVSAGS